MGFKKLSIAYADKNRVLPARFRWIIIEQIMLEPWRVAARLGQIALSGRKSDGVICVRLIHGWVFIRHERSFFVKRTLIFLWILILLAGCQPQEHTRQTFAMDTIMLFTVYGPQGQQALNHASERIQDLDNLFSVTRPESDVYAVNHTQGEWTEVSEETEALLSQALELCRQTNGALDVTAYPAVRAWGFTTGEYQIPDERTIQGLLSCIDYSQVELDGNWVRLPEDMELDFGAVAKGYAGEVLAQELREMGVKSATLTLGGNVQTIGSRPTGDPWRIGVQDPEGDGYLMVLSLVDQAAVTSGGYQRYFEENGTRYWHIIDPDTAAPARSGLLSVTIVGDSGTQCDALSTALFVMGRTEAAQYWREHRDFEAVLVSGDGSIAVTAGLEGRCELAPGYEDREVEVIRP